MEGKSNAQAIIAALVIIVAVIAAIVIPAI